MCRGPGLIPWADVRPHPIPHPVFIPHLAANNPVARAHWTLIHPRTVSCTYHGLHPSRPFPLVPRPPSNPLGCCAPPSHPSFCVYTPPDRQQPCGAGPLDPHQSGDPFVRLARVAPLPPPPLTPVPPPIAHRLGRAPLRLGYSNPGRLFVVFSPLPRTLQSVAPGSPLDDPAQGLGPCSTPPLMLQSGASFCRIFSLASDAPVRGTGFTPR